MNNSKRTAIIAMGVSLLSDVNNLPSNKVTGSIEEKNWNSFQNTYPQFVAFVKQEQFDLFDRVNRAF